MSKKVLVISTSLRPGSNSECLAQKFARGAKEAGNSVEILSLKGKENQLLYGLFCLSGKRFLRDKG